MVIAHKIMKLLEGVLVSVPRLKVDVGDQVDLKPLRQIFAEYAPLFGLRSRIEKE